jgi:molybdopterin molybdotransferase
MVSVLEAINLIWDHSFNGKPKELSILEANNLVLAESIYSPINFPPFDQSAMDGYAICMNENTSYKLVSEIKAGDDTSNVIISPGQAARIFTGAMLPKGCNSVVKQEDVELKNEEILLKSTPFLHENERLKGEQIKKGALAVSKYTTINPGVIGFLAGLGIQNISVFSKPKIGIIATGNELIQPGETLLPGKIYESNSVMLQSAINNANFETDRIVIKDDYSQTVEAVKDAIENYDVVLFTGGISVGDYDFVYKALQENQVQDVFYKIKQKPGKPMYFGTKSGTLIFGLPGNPAAALTCFYTYILPCLKTKIGIETDEQFQTMMLGNSYEKSANLTHILKGKIVGNHVEILPAQSSAMLISFVEADALIFLEEGQTNWNVGDLVKVMPIS